MLPTNFWLEQIADRYGESQAPGPSESHTPIAHLNRQMDELVKKWEPTTILRDVQDIHIRRQMATLLESQRLFNAGTGFEGGTDPDTARFKRISIPLVKQVYGKDNPLYRMVSVQAKTGPVSQVYLKHAGQVRKIDNAALSKNYRTPWQFDAPLVSCNGLDAECELTSVVAQEIQLEIVREVASDLREVAPIKMVASATIPHIRHCIAEASARIKESTGHQPNWVYTGPNLASGLWLSPTMNDEFTSSFMIREVGMAGQLRMLNDPLCPPHSILLGYRGEDHFDSGYVWSPYLVASQTSVVLDPDSFCPRRGLLGRYGKYFHKDGPSYFAAINIDDRYVGLN